MSESARFRLSAEAYESARSVARGEPAPGLALLERSNLVNNGKLVDGLARALAVLGRPTRACAVTRLRPGESHFASLALAGGEGEGFAVHGGDEASHDILWLESAEEAALYAGDFLDVTSPRFEATSASGAVSAAGWCALLAIADSIRASRLESELRRQPTAEAGRFDERQAEVMLRSGLASDDTRWAVTAEKAMAPPGSLAAGQFGAGLAELSSGGIVAGPGLLSDLGRLITDELSCAITWGLILTTNVAGKQARALTVIRSPLSAWFLAWAGEGQPMRLARSDSDNALLRLRDALVLEPELQANVPITGARFCANCGRQRSDQAKFCGGCGARFR